MTYDEPVEGCEGLGHHMIRTDIRLAPANIPVEERLS